MRLPGSYPVSTDILQRRLNVEETVARDGKGKTVLGPPKSDASTTTITMPKALADVLAKHMAMRGLTAADGDAFLFPDKRSGPLRYSNWRNRVWLPAIRAAGLEGVGFHDLRRATATALVAEGVDIRLHNLGCVTQTRG